MGKLLCFPMSSVGHTTICLALARYLIAKYGKKHEIVFLLDAKFSAKIRKVCPEIKIHEYVDPSYPINFDATKDEDPTAKAMDFFSQTWQLPLAKRAAISSDHFCNMLQRYKVLQKSIEQAIAEEKPDYILHDHLFNIPFLMNKNIPWGFVNSTNPLYAQYTPSCIPPSSSGISIFDTEEKGREFSRVWNAGMKPFHDKLNEWLKEEGVEQLKDGFLVRGSPFLNLYCYPRELDYFTENDCRLEGNWKRIDSCVVSQEAMIASNSLMEDKLPTFQFEQECDEKRKLIFFSLGSLVSTQVNLMQKLLDILETIPHNFIVSKGYRGDRLRLPSNCAGENFLPQLQILQIIDLIIFHGGNNTFTESVHFGVPMIIMPVFGDQLDNAQRVKDMQVGTSLNLFNVTRDQLINAIESTLKDEQAKQRLSKISQRIQTDDNWVKLCQNFDTILSS